MNVHPKTGLRYIISVRSCLEYDDILRMYKVAAAKHDWLECVTERELVPRLDEIGEDERNFVVMWGVWAPRPPARRKAMFTRVYSESYDEDEEKMIGYHRNWISSARANIRHMDGVFGNTPWMAQQLATEKVPGYVLPIGWCPDSFGKPSWRVKKTHRFTYKGHVIGKRPWLVHGMQQSLRKDMQMAQDIWGKKFIGMLNKSSTYLHLSHSDTHSFETFRIWEALASSAALIAEEGRDCWPMTKEMYIGVPTITRKKGPPTVRKIRGISDAEYKRTAKKLHEALAADFTTEKILTDYLIPASEQIKERKV